MKTRLIMTGKTEEGWIQQGCEVYLARIIHYLPFQAEVIPDIRNTRKMPVNTLRRMEAERIMEKLHPGEFMVLLDENGQGFTSEGFASFLAQQPLKGTRNLCFVIAGAFGADPMLKERADLMLSLSGMTFPHQLVRVIFLEQLYRALSINRGEKYHNV